MIVIGLYEMRDSILLLPPPGGIAIGRVCWIVRSFVCLFVCLFVRLFVRSLTAGHWREDSGALPTSRVKPRISIYSINRNPWVKPLPVRRVNV